MLKLKKKRSFSLFSAVFGVVSHGFRSLSLLANRSASVTHEKRERSRAFSRAQLYEAVCALVRVGQKVAQSQ